MRARLPAGLRPRLPAGLRPRLVLALVLTGAVTLAAAAAALLPRLERRLRHEEVRSLVDTAVAARSSFADLPGGAIRAGDPRLERLARSLEFRTGARVAVFDTRGTRLADTRPSAPFPVFDASDLSGPRGKLREGGETPDVAEVSMPVHGQRRFVVGLVKPLDDVSAAANDVRRAFTEAAFAGLAVAFLVGLALATTLLRRLRRLRASALEVGDSGLDVDFAADPSRDEVGDLARAFSTMQRQLRRQEAARRTFVATASHELRTPLASLEAMLDLLEADLTAAPPDVDDARIRAAAAHAQSRRLAALAAGLLDLSRLDAGGDMRREPVELGEVCRAVAAEFDARGGVDLADQGDQTCWASADPSSVARILRILIDNALRYGAAPIEVAAEAGDGEAQVVVRDHGPGIPPEERETVFERFQRGSASAPESGFGLGLAIGRELARRMHGDLVLDDGRPGARFTLVLPASSETFAEEDSLDPLSGAPAEG